MRCGHGWAVVLAVSLALYANSLDNTFHYDDEHSIQKNIHVRTLENVPSYFVEPGMFSDDPAKGMYRPLLLVTYAANHAVNRWFEVDGYDVRGYHFLNIFLHGLNACMLWWFTVLTLRRKDVALLAGLLFALHPLGTEPANYISSRSESLGALFYLAAMAFFARAVLQRAQDTVGSAAWISASWLALACGLLSKSTVITLPAVLLLYDYLVVSGRSWRELRLRLFRVHGPYWMIILLHLWIITSNQYLSRSLSHSPRDGWSQFLTQTEVFSYYLKLLLFPTGLNVEHQFFAQRTFGDGTTVMALLLLLTTLLLVGCLYLIKRDMSLFVLLWGSLALLPVVVVPLNVLVNERRLYLTSAAFCLALALLMRSEWLRLGRTPRAKRVDVGIGLAALVLLTFAGLSLERNRVWADDFSLWSDSVSRSPAMPRPHLYLGNAHKDAAFATPDTARQNQHWRKAAASYRNTIAVAKDPEHLDLALRGLNNLGGVSFVLGDFDTAEKAYREAARVNPRYPDAEVNLATIYMVRGRQSADPTEKRELWEQGLKHLDKAIRLAPNHGAAYANRGLTLFYMLRLEEARKGYERAVFLNPRDYKTWGNLGSLELHLYKEKRLKGAPVGNHLKKSQKFFQEALRITPHHPDALRGLRTVQLFLSNP